MLRYLYASNAKQLTADAAAVGANVVAGWTWLAQVNDILQAILTIVAIGAGIAAWRWHRAQRLALEKKDES